MEGILKLNKSKFYSKSIRFVISFLLVSFCISGVRCMMPPIDGYGGYTSGILFEAGIQPLPENHGRWSKEEVDTVIDAIATVAKHHGLKKKWQPDRGYTLSGEYFYLTLNACFLYDKDAWRHKSPSFIESSNPLPWGRKLNIQKGKGTIWISILHLSSPSITDSERLFVEKIWHELLDPLRKKFGDRIEDERLYADRDSRIKIYKLEP